MAGADRGRMRRRANPRPIPEIANSAREKRDAMHYSEVRSAPPRAMPLLVYSSPPSPQQQQQQQLSVFSDARQQARVHPLARLKIDNRPRSESCNRVNFHPIMMSYTVLRSLYTHTGSGCLFWKRNAIVRIDGEPGLETVCVCDRTARGETWAVER